MFCFLLHSSPRHETDVDLKLIVIAVIYEVNTSRELGMTYQYL